MPQAPRKLKQFKAANDRPVPAPQPRISVISFAPSKKAVGRLASVSVVALGLGFLGLSLWMAQQSHQTITATTTLPTAAEQQKLTDIILPASNLSEPADESEVNLVASTIRDLPALNGKPKVSVAPPEEVDTHELLVRAHEKLQAGQTDAANALYQQILTLEPRNHDALAGQAYLLASTGADEEAMVLSQKLLRFYPHDDAAAANLAHLLMRMAKFDEAITYLDQAARAAPERLSYRLDLATLYDRTGHRDEALMLYRQILATAANNEVTGLPLGSIRQRMDYLETLGSDAGNSPAPSTTMPVDP